MLPIVIFILGMVLGMKFTRALIAALTVGVGFIGLSLVIGLLFTALGPATAALVERTGLNLVSLDVGWGVAAAIAFGTTVGALIIPLAFAINIIFLLLKWTKTLNVDIWNFWHFAFTGSLVYLVTGGSILWGLVGASVHAIIALLLADLTAKRVQEFFRIPGMSIPQGWAITSVPIILGLNWVVDKIPGVRDIRWDDETLQSKLGVFGTPIHGLYAWAAVRDSRIWLRCHQSIDRGDSDGCCDGIDPSHHCNLHGRIYPVIRICPRIHAERFSGREVYIGLDSAILIGHPITITAGIILIPITLILQQFYPATQHCQCRSRATAFFVAMVPPFNRGNLFRSILYGTIIMIVVLYISSAFAPLFTQVASNIGFAFPEGAVQITGLSGGNWIAWVLTTIGQLIYGIPPGGY